MALYAYGHLVSIVFAIAFAVAFTLSGLLNRNARSDLIFGALFAVGCVVACADLQLALAPSELACDVFFAGSGVAFATAMVAAYYGFARRVLLPGELRRLRYFVIAFVAIGIALVACHLNGLRTYELAGWTLGAPAITPPIAALLFAYCCAPLVLVRVMFAPGPLAIERRAAGIAILMSPLIVAHDLAIDLGWLRSLPIGSYVGWIAGVPGLVAIVMIRGRASDAVIVGDYVIEKKLGAGGMADVFLARRRARIPGLDQRVALKRLRSSVIGERAATTSFLDEARVLARLSHPNIVRLHDAGWHGDELFLAIELVDGATLAECLRLGPLELDAAAEACRQLCDALAYVHDASVVHRDLKPHNVLVTRDGTVKLSDFGVAWFAARGASTQTGELKGTLRYLSPEQLAGEALDGRVDVHALGLVWFECVTGAPFFDGASDAEILAQVRTRRRDDAPASVRAVFERAAAIDPAARAGVRELRSALPGDHTTGKQLLAARVAAVAAARQQTSEAVTVTRHPVV